MLGKHPVRTVALAAAALATIGVVPAAYAHGGHQAHHVRHHAKHHHLPHHRPGHHRPKPAVWTCGPSASALGYSDSLDKLTYDGMKVGGLSDIAWDPHTHAYVSAVDNNADDPSRIWSYTDLADPEPVGDPIVLTTPDGTPYTGQTADNEGLAVLPDGDFVISSETEPSVRIYSPRGRQLESLPVPARFAVTPAGESPVNATFEGLTLSKDGRQIIVSMEGTLAGDTGDGTFRRLLVYTQRPAHHHRPHSGATWALTKQIGYRVDPGMRIPEVQEYADGKLLVMEASWTAEVGNTIKLYAVDLRHATDVSRVTDLAAAPRKVVKKTLVSDVTSCPSLGAVAKETQTNPLMDNFEGMIAQPARHGLYDVTLISDDNFSTTQTTRLLRLAARLP